ncbi:MAG: right-handed parallel beta-helix repeat-containing protein, partial [Candidatus Sumerlaeota bacterium]|nr:right-handed parallel beta-helix repeat-containing protein [Candidatus Sumerlaeota bacterium]
MIGVRGDLAFVIDGIDIRYAPAVGIGASLWGDGSGCSIRNCRFTGNRGTAVTLSALSFTMNNCVFENNADVALNLDEGSFTIDQCVFTGNKGGFRAIAGGVISNCLIAGNCGESFGGIRFEGSVSIINCTISGNFATSGNFDATGGIKCATHWMWIWRPFSPPGPLSPAPFLLPPGEWMPWPSHGNVVNCILSGNGPNGIYFDSLSSLTAQNCLFFENGYAAQSDYYNLPHNSHSDHHDYLDAASLNSSLPGAAGNLDGDPAFANAAAGDFHLTAGSAAIDRGTSVPLAWDLNGAPQPVDIPGVGVDGPLAYDIGACEYQFLTPIGPPSLSSELDAGDGAVGLAWTDDNATTPSQFLSFAYDVYAGEFAPRGWAGTIWYPFAPPARSGPMNVAETGAYFAWISDQ